jgi:hypothetical protein
MSKRLLHIEIDCGDKTCASAPGRFCSHLVTTRFGSRFHCSLFSKHTGGKHGYEQLEQKDGWLIRHPDCFRHEAT